MIAITCLTLGLVGCAGSDGAVSATDSTVTTTPEPLSQISAATAQRLAFDFCQAVGVGGLRQRFGSEGLEELAASYAHREFGGARERAATRGCLKALRGA